MITTLSHFLRERIPSPMTAREIDRRARAAWDNVAGATGARTSQAQKIARTYTLCRDLQQAVADGDAGTGRAVVDLIRDVYEDAQRTARRAA